MKVTPCLHDIPSTRDGLSRATVNLGRMHTLFSSLLTVAGGYGFVLLVTRLRSTLSKADKATARNGMD